MFYKLLLLIIVLCPLSSRANTLLVLGDSLSASYGMAVDKGWVSLLEQRLIRIGVDYNIVNASISGDTTLNAKNRLAKLLQDNNPSIVIVELGGNDGLRGFALSEIEQNLTDIIKMIRASNARVLLVPMQLPPNYGQAYNQQFRSIYQRISDSMDIKMTHFILDGIAIHSHLMQPDGIHPLESAQEMILENLWEDIIAVIK